MIAAPERQELRRNQRAARLAFSGAVAFIVLLVSAHILMPELDPSWHVISEYAIGNQGWVMTLAFFALATAFAGLFFTLRSEARGVIGGIGLVLLLVAALGLVLGGAFPTDPITASGDERTTIGAIHQIGATMGTAVPLAAIFLTWSLAGKPGWRSGLRYLLPMTVVAVLAMIAAIVIIGQEMVASGGTLGPGVDIGWMNRIEIGIYAAWVIVTAWQAHAITRKIAQESRLDTASHGERLGAE